MVFVRFHCLPILFLVLLSGSSAEVTKRFLIYDTYPTKIMHGTYPTTIMRDTYPTNIPPDNPTGDSGDVPTFNPTPTTPTTTPTTTPPLTPATNPPNMPTTPPTTTPTTPMNPTPPSGGGGDAGGGVGGGGAGGGDAGGGVGGGDGGVGGGGAGGGDGGGGAGGGVGGGGDGGGGVGGGGAGGGIGGGGGGGAGGGAGGGGGGGGGSWCVAKPGASEKALQVGLDYACGYGGADCSAIQPGGSCASPDTVKDHASYAYNSYYQKNPAPTSCDFGGTAQIVSTDPSTGNCHYSSSKGSTSTTPPTSITPPTSSIDSPPTSFSPPSPSLGNFPGPPLGGASVYGPEPTGSPNMASATSERWIIFFCSTSIFMYILLANN